MGMNFHRGKNEGSKVNGIKNSHDGIHEGCQMKGQNGRIVQMITKGSEYN